MAKPQKTEPKTNTADLADRLIDVLKLRFERHPHRHPGISWQQVQSKLDANPGALKVLHQMETTGGEPDVIGRDEKTQQLLFCDCAEESPKGRRSLCFDQQARVNRKDFPPQNSAEEMAAEMGVELLDEVLYRHLQSLQAVDLKSSSWISTPAKIRQLGGALFADRRYDTVFVYHNGAASYYAVRGFRGLLRV